MVHESVTEFALSRTVRRAADTKNPNRMRHNRMRHNWEPAPNGSELFEQPPEGRGLTAITTTHRSSCPAGSAVAVTVKRAKDRQIAGLCRLGKNPAGAVSQTPPYQSGSDFSKRL